MWVYGKCRDNPINKRQKDANSMTTVVEKAPRRPAHAVVSAHCQLTAVLRPYLNRLVDGIV